MIHILEIKSFSKLLRIIISYGEEFHLIIRHCLTKFFLCFEYAPFCFIKLILVLGYETKRIEAFSLFFGVVSHDFIVSSFHLQCVSFDKRAIPYSEFA